MTSFFIIFLMGLGILISWLGWGWLISSLLNNEIDEIGYYCGIGLSFMIVIGGVLNISGLISKISISVLIIVGASAFLVYFLKKYSEIISRALSFKNYLINSKIAVLIIFSLVLMVAIKYSAAVSPGPLNAYDDYQSYFVFPLKMMQTGSMGNDPFSLNRMFSLGGQSFLDTLILPFGNENNFRFIDEGIAFLAFVIVLYSFLSSIKIPKSILSMVMAVAILIPAPIATSSAMYSGLTLFTVLVWLFYIYSNKEDKKISVIYLGLIAAAICSLKSNLLPAVIFIILALFSLRAKNGPPRMALKELLQFLVATIVFMSSWMLALYNSSKTFFYPLLGSGFHGSAYGMWPAPSNHWNFENIIYLIGGAQGLILAMFFISILLFILDKDFRDFFQEEDLYLGVALFLSILTIGYVTAGLGFYRYSFAFSLSIILIIFSKIFLSEKDGDCRFKRQSIGLVLIAVVLGGSFSNFVLTEIQTLQSLFFGLRGGQIASSIEVREYEDMQKSIPEGKTILVRLDKNFLLNFRRNNIYIMEYPGGASLPPGIPLDKGPESLVSYLISNNIDYIAYSPKANAGTPQNPCQSVLDPRDGKQRHAEVCNEFKGILDFQKNIDKIIKTNKIIYNNKELFVIALEK